MNTHLLTWSLFLAFPLICLKAENQKTWPFHDVSLRDAALAGLRLKLFQEGGFHSLPKGISLYLDAAEEPEDGWFMVTLRQMNGEGSGGDPNVSPALVHFYVKASDGTIEWYDVVEDKRRSWAEFLKDRAEP
jgi:hypothetical protein